MNGTDTFVQQKWNLIRFSNNALFVYNRNHHGKEKHMSMFAMFSGLNVMVQFNQRLLKRMVLRINVVTFKKMRYVHIQCIKIIFNRDLF